MLNRLKGLGKGRDDDGDAPGACPECDRPTLPAWGATCGLCRPPVGVAPRLGLPPHADAGGEALGWVVVMDCPDAARIGQVVPVDGPAVVLTRDSGALSGPAKEIAFRDEFMSAGHALVRRQPAGARAPFSVEDRRTPGPSANGTFLNGRRLAPAEVADLCDGDALRVGGTELVFRSLWLRGAGR
jgi:hypothetical protein